ncbi:MAG TPA: DUF3786 domain-containing protein [Syntrophomonadaceae bacterium]|nr:DUF3786 domain-containing protein [Syntrophomonadaceae bacterium]
MDFDVLLEAKKEFACRFPEQMAELSGGRYDPEEKLISISYLNEIYRISFPDGEFFEGEQSTPLTIEEKALVLQYLSQATGQPLRGKWVSFSDLPNGMLHDAPFKVEAVEPLAEIFGGQPGKLLDVAKSLGATELKIGDAGVVIPVFPHITVAIILWLGDEEFSARANMVFDAVAPNYLSTAALYVLGANVTRRLCKAVR